MKKAFGNCISRLKNFRNDCFLGLCFHFVGNDKLEGRKANRCQSDGQSLRMEEIVVPFVYTYFHAEFSSVWLIPVDKTKEAFRCVV